jgi:sec-independent protein translocase protein TatA
MEIVIVLVVALIVLGPKRLPQTASSLGQGLRSFKRGLSGTELEAGPAPEPASADPGGQPS